MTAATDAGDVGHGSKSKAEPQDVWADPRKAVAAALTTFSPGAAMSFYLAGVGFFVVAFKSRTVLLWMLLAAFCPFPIALLLQEQFDSFFDKVHSTRVTFFFRIIVLPLLMAVIIGILALLCTLWVPVIVCGLVLGFMCAATIGSSLQMTSTWDPLLVVWAQIGNTVGSTTAVAAFFIFSFTASKASKLEFQVILLVPIGVCIITSSILMYWHFKYDLFEHVFRRLAYDLTEEDGFPPPVMSLQRGTSADAPVYPREDVDSHGVPLWVPWYNVAAALNIFSTYLLLPFATYFGDADLAQTLVLAKFVMDFLGRSLALLWGYLNKDLREPIHVQLILQLISRLMIGLLLALSLLRMVSLHRAMFLAMWCFFFLGGTCISSQIDVLSIRCTVVSQRKAVSRRNAFLCYAGLLIGLGLSFAVLYLTEIEDSMH